MSLSIEQIEEQIANLQKNLQELKSPKLQISRSFTGQYFDLYKGMQYRRMESDGVPIWEVYLAVKKEWVVVIQDREAKDLEKVYTQDCLSKSE
jgi:hypothetical protein